MQNNSLTIRQARLQGQEGLWQITIEDGRFSRIDPQETASAPVGQVLDAECGLVIPPFIEPHIHLDTTQTAGEPNSRDADPEVANRQRHSVRTYTR